jgi:hypothetical protein
MKKLFILSVLLLALAFIVFGCGTGGSVVKVGEAPGGYTTLIHDGITLRLSYIDQRDLYKLYGQKNNPFMNYKTGRLIVIDTAIQSDKPLRLVLGEAQLSTPGGNRGPTPKEDVYYYWYSRLINNYGSYSRFSSPHESNTTSQRSSESSIYVTNHGCVGRNKFDFHNWSLKVTTQIIDESILPDAFDVPADTETMGYFLFNQVRGEKKVDAVFTLPIYDQQGDLVHRFEFQFPI